MEFSGVTVGEFFELRTQVDRGLTIDSRVDRRLGLIKNLGRHRCEATRRVSLTREGEGAGQ
jgi:hypothetical protein